MGTGPFRIVDGSAWRSGDSEEFENNFDQERPKLDRLVITPVDGTEPMATAIEAGDVG